MKTATRPDDLEILGHLLQADLQSKLSQNVPVQVRCLLKGGTLVLLVQHRAGVEPDPQQTFGFLEQTILAEHQSEAEQVKIYLRVAGQKQPYAFHSFTTEPLVESTATATSVEEIPDASRYSAPSTTEEIEGIEGIDSNPLETEPTQSTSSSATASALPHPWDQPIPGVDAENVQPSEPENIAAASDEPAVATPGASGDALPDQTLEKKKFDRSLLPLVATGVGVSLVVFSTSVYFLTRPCVMGPCRAIPEAQDLSQRSAQTLQKPQSGKEVLEAQQQMRTAIRILETIPMWSSKHSEAQDLIQAYAVQAERVDEMVNALKTGARASYKSENPPHPPSRWMEIQSLWREAIAQLEQLPTNSNLQPLAQQKIKAYKANLAETNRRLVKERQAQGQLNAAKEAALIAEARQGVAQSLPHWQLVYATWQTAMKGLKQIPKGTTAYEDAQQLSAQYLPKMASARDRKTEEQIAANAYSQGLRLAQLAQNSQVNNQWSTALNQWRNALTYVNQVPNGTFYYSKARLLANSYTNALKQTQGQLQLVIKLQQVRNDLNQTCSGKAKAQVCNFTLNYNVIKVRLTPTYVQLVKQTALNAQVTRDSQVQSGLVNHVLTLGQALEAISDNSRIPMQVYGPDGSLIKEHLPS